MNQYFQVYPKTYGKLPIDNLSDAKGILGTPLTNLYLSHKIVMIAFDCWKDGLFGDPEVCSSPDRIEYLVTSSIAHVDHLIESYPELYTRAKLPGKEVENVEANLSQACRNQSETILFLAKDLPALIDKKFEEFLSPLKPRTEHQEPVMQRRAARAVSPARHEIPSPAANENRAPGPNEHPAPGPPAPPQFKPTTRTPPNEFIDQERVKIKSSNKKHGGKLGRVETKNKNSRKGYFIVHFDDGTSHEFQPRSLLTQRAYDMWEDGEGVTINVEKYAHYTKGEITVVLSATTDEYVAVNIPNEGVFLVYQTDVKSTDW